MMIAGGHLNLTQHMLEQRRRVTYRERGEMENGIEIKEIK